MSIKIDKKLNDALDLIGCVDRRAAEELRRSLATSKTFTLTEKVVHRDECKLKQDPEIYARYRVHDLRRSIVGRGVPMLYKTYLKHRSGWIATMIPTLLANTIADAMTDLFVADLVDELFLPSALAATGIDVASLRRTFNESLYNSFLNEARLSQDDGGLCLASVERIEVSTWVYIRHKPIEPRKPIRKRRKPVSPKKLKAKKKYDGILSMRSSPRKQAAILKPDNDVRTRVPPLTPTVKPLEKTGIRLPKASDDPGEFRCRSRGKGTECFQGNTKLSLAQICVRYRDRIPSGSGIKCPPRKPNMALVAKTYGIKIPTIADKANERHRALIRKNWFYWALNNILFGVNTKRLVRAAYELEAMGRKR